MRLPNPEKKTRAARDFWGSRSAGLEEESGIAFAEMGSLLETVKEVVQDLAQGAQRTQRMVKNPIFATFAPLA